MANIILVYTCTSVVVINSLIELCSCFHLKYSCQTIGFYHILDFCDYIL